MISYSITYGSRIREYYGKSTDEKPVEGVPNCSTFYEIDGQHRLYMFDAESQTWLLQ